MGGYSSCKGEARQARRHPHSNTQSPCTANEEVQRTKKEKKTTDVALRGENNIIDTPLPCFVGKQRRLMYERWINGVLESWYVNGVASQMQA